MKLLSFMFLVTALLVAATLGGARSSASQPVTSYTEASYVTDVSDPQRLVGLATNVFVGRVVSLKGTHYPDEIPESLFTVEVLDNLKGDLRGEVVVNQQGGVWPTQAGQKPEAAVHLVNDDPLLIVGQTYLFATLPDKEGRWHTLIPVYGDVVISGAAERATVAETYRAAVASQIRYDPTYR